MYTSFFGFTEPPFNLMPDPRYLYLAPSHQEAFAYMVYGIQEIKGYTVITGEVGTGKTTLLHTLLEHLDISITSAFVFYPKLDIHDFLQYVLNEFGLQTAPTGTTAQYLIQLQQFLIDQHAKGKTTVLVVDEAQNLSLPLLEDIRMLSNLETPGAKLLQIILVGQPELQHKLQSPCLRQLRQRITIAHEIRPLSYTETQAYIQHRCRVAGGDAGPLFTTHAVKAIHAYAAGIPRLINIVCDRALLIGYGDEQPRVTRRIVQQAVRDLGSWSRRSALASWSRRAAAILVGGLLLSLGLYIGREISTGSWAVLPVPPPLQRQHQHVTAPTAQPVAAPRESPAVRQEPPEPPVRQQHEVIQAPETNVPLPSPAPDTHTPEEPVVNEATHNQAVAPATVSETSNEAFDTKNIQFPIRKTVQKGDYVSKYAMEIYGFSNNTLLAWIKKNNPHIQDLNNIRVGEVLVFPALDASSSLSQ